PQPVELIEILQRTPDLEPTLINPGRRKRVNRLVVAWTLIARNARMLREYHTTSLASTVLNKH
ncbi:hypothetical protein, partial [Klebsiella pneumoniae]|uniref:hypothetical protein n=1 Tax=Klebsiella pneumoniae TaxID=573 RepID=UPI0025A020CB